MRVNVASGASSEGNEGLFLSSLDERRNCSVTQLKERRGISK
jgi:hypothetical protein